MEMKMCSRCGKELPATTEYFAVNKRIKSGIQARCKECDRQYRLENKERKAEYNRKYREENKERLTEYDRKYNEENKERRAEHNRKYREENKDRIKKYHEENKGRKAEYNRKYREENKERIKKYIRKYNEENKERLTEYIRKYNEENKERRAEYNRKHREENRELYRSYTQRRTSLKRNLPSTLTINQWQHAQSYFNHGCAYCGSATTLEQDHFWPLSRGGGYTATNIIPACGSCNSSKHNKPFEEWYPTHESYSPEREAKIYEYFEQLALENGQEDLKKAKKYIEFMMEENNEL